MSIPYNQNLSLDSYRSNPQWYVSVPATEQKAQENQSKRAAGELLIQGKQSVVRTVQFLRDTARLVLKVPIRAIATPVFLEKNWQERERAKVNAKLTGYAFVQLLSVPAKFVVALVALATSAVSKDKANWLLDKSECWTARLDGRASQLEALKEEGAKKTQTKEEFEQYKAWLYGINPKLCRRIHDKVS